MWKGTALGLLGIPASARPSLFPVPAHLPVHGMVPPVADVDGNAAEGGFEDGVPRVALHVIG